MKIEIPPKIEKLMKKYKKEWCDGTSDNLYDYFFNNENANDMWSDGKIRINGTLDVLEDLQLDYCSDGCKPYKDLELIKKWLYYIYSKEDIEKLYK